MRNKYTEEQLNYLKNGYKKMTYTDLTKSFNKKFGSLKSAGAIKSVLKRKNFKGGTAYSKGYKPWNTEYTEEQLNFLKDSYLIMKGPELTKAFNEKFNTSKTLKSIYTLLKRHGFKSGRSGCYPKNHKPWNAGTKGLVKPNKGNFKKGHVPQNRKPVGSERICPKDGFILIKVNEENPYTKFKTRWKFKHLMIWEKANGSVPKGMVVAFRDGDNTNCVLENLMLISRAELLRLNQKRYKEIPNELKPSVLLVTKLQVKTWEKEKGSNNE